MSSLDNEQATTYSNMDPPAYITAGERSAAANTIQTASDESTTNMTISSFTGRDMSKLQTTLDKLNFDDLQGLIPWTKQMEEDAKSEDDGHENYKPEPQDPFNDAEIAMLRRMMRRRHMELFNEEKDKLIDEVDPELAKDRTVRGVALRKIKEKELYPMTKLSEDTFSFLISSRLFTIPWFLGFGVLCLKTSIFILITVNLINLKAYENPLGIPASVSAPVFVSQFFALFIAVTSQDDIRTALNYFYEGYEKKSMGRAFIGASWTKWCLSVWLQFLEGALGLSTTFLLIVTSDDVVSLLLDFTAVEFVTLLDNTAFSLANQGFLGPKNKLESEIIMETDYPVQQNRQKTPGRQIMTLIGTFVIMLAGWGVIYYRQLTGVYTIKNIYVQFDDDLKTELGAYTGYFELEIRPWTIGIERLRYNAVNGDGYFGYCSKERAWTFSLEGDNPCDHALIQSSDTLSFDINEVAGEEWSVTEDADSERFFPMEAFFISAGCQRDWECGGHGNGKCQANKCICAEGRYGMRCDYEAASTCEKVQVDTQRPVFRNSREYATEYSLLRDGDEKIVTSYNHAVYYNDTGDGLDVLLYMGFRWGLTHSVTGLEGLDVHTREGLAAYLSKADFHAATQLQGLEFFSDPIEFNTPDDGPSPVGISWWLVRDASLENTGKQAPTEARLLCAVCDDDENPCQNGNTCGAGGVCDCSNGAEGALCQITPLGNGHCDVYFNTASFDYDGGDCCQSTCINGDSYSCGVVSSGTIENLDRGFPYCVDPTVLDSSCESCWAPNSRDLGFLSVENPALTFLSANGRIMAMAEPAMDAIRVFDQVDSTWTQRGPILEGPRGSQFGKTLALSTLPGAVIGRRFGKVPILMAIGLHGTGNAGIRVVRWEPNDLDWRPVGDTIDICSVGDSFNSTSCDLKALDIVRMSDRVTLSVVRTDNLALVYRHTLSETGGNPWVLQYYAIGSEKGDLGAQPKETDIFVSTSVSPTAGGFYPDGNSVVFGIGVSTEFVRLSDKSDFPNDGNVLENAQNMHRFLATEKKLEFTFDNPQAASDFIAVRTQIGWDVRELEDREVGAVKVTPDGLTFLIHMYGDLGLDTIARYELSGSQLFVTNIANYTSAALSQDQVDAGISPVRYSFDGTSYAIREPSSDGKNIIHIMKYDSDIFNFRSVGTPFEDKGLDMSISYDAGVYVRGLASGSSEGYGLVPRCTDGKYHYRLAITLDETPESLEWIVETYQTLGSISFAGRQIRQCDHCYFDNDRFGRGVVAEDICVPKDEEVCSRLRFKASQGLRPGAGIVAYREGEEAFKHEGRETSEVIFNFDDEADVCAIQELQCGEQESHIILELQFDARPRETSWTLQDSSGVPLGQGAGYTAAEYASKTVPFQMCGPKGASYKLVVEDNKETFADGLCCTWGDGGYNLYVDYEKVYSREGERIFRFDTVIFDAQGIIEEPVPVTFEFQLDEYSEETAWQIERPTDFVSLYFNAPYEAMPNELVSQTIYLSPNQEYILAIRDLYEDGFCCSVGNGYFNVYYGNTTDPNTILVSGTGEFVGPWKEVLFTVSEDSILLPAETDEPAETVAPTQVPTPSPTSAPTPAPTPQTQAPSAVNAAAEFEQQFIDSPPETTNATEGTAAVPGGGGRRRRRNLESGYRRRPH